MIATEPDGSLFDGFNEAAGSGKPKYGQLAICYHANAATARLRAPAAAFRHERLARHVRAARSPLLRPRIPPDQRGHHRRGRSVRPGH